MIITTSIYPHIFVLLVKERGGKRSKRGCTKTKRKKKIRTIYVAKPKEYKITDGPLKTTLKVTDAVAFQILYQKENWPTPTKTDTKGYILTGDRPLIKLTLSASWRQSLVRTVINNIRRFEIIYLRPLILLQELNLQLKINHNGGNRI